MQPDNASVLDNIGWILFLKGDTAGALEKLREANRRSGGQNPDILFHLAAAEAKTGSIDASRKILGQLFEIGPEDHVSVQKGRELLTRLN